VLCIPLIKYLPIAGQHPVGRSHLRVNHLATSIGEGARPVRSVLVVDDNATIRKAVCELLTREGDFEVCGEAENGQDAVEKAQQLRPALIVTDLFMPLMNGLEETRILKKLMPAVPVVIFTVHSDPFIEREGLAAGASAVVSKSDAVAVLIGKARELLENIAA
jgi:DNA-binding NarL/FixJ family response regulator